MDPISQGAMGAVAAASFSKGSKSRIAIGVGWAAGMLADADIFIRSEADPLLNIEYHRHFSHSIAFIPIGGLVCAVVLWLLLRKRLAISELYLYSVYGYATAGLLDACTSYGTRLLWPFSESRIAWNIISIIDPVFTGGILALLLATFIAKKRLFSRIAFVYAGLYLLFGLVQNKRASTALEELALSRGHYDAARFTVKPSFANLLVWRGLYIWDGDIHVEAIRVGLFDAEAKLYPGTVAKGVDLVELKAGIELGSTLSRDIDRFNHFSDGYLAWHPDRDNVIGDARYALLPNSADPLWGIAVDSAKPDLHAPFLNFRNADDEAVGKLLKMIRGQDLEPYANPDSDFRKAGLILRSTTPP